MPAGRFLGFVLQEVDRCGDLNCDSCREYYGQEKEGCQEKAPLTRGVLHSLLARQETRRSPSILSKEKFPGNPGDFSLILCYYLPLNGILFKGPIWRCGPKNNQSVKVRYRSHRPPRVGTRGAF